MDTLKKEHLLSLKTEYQKRLHALELQQARYGSDTPPHIVVEISDLQAKINALHKEIENTYGNPALPLIELTSNFAPQLETISQNIRNDHTVLQKDFDNMRKHLQIQGIKFDGDTLSSARKGVRHLMEGVNSGSVDIKNNSFILAYSDFCRLISINEDNNDKPRIKLEEYSKEYASFIGYWGNFHYFNLMGDKRSAAIQVYSLSKKYPRIGVAIFSSKFFSRDYNALLESAEAESQAMANRLENFNLVDRVIDQLEYEAGIGGMYGIRDELYFSGINFVKQEINDLITHITRVNATIAMYLAEIFISSGSYLSELQLVNFDLNLTTYNKER